MSDQVFLLPDLGEGLTEADILEWKVTVGDTVRIDQAVVEVETAKASVEVPIPFGGIVVTLHGEEGATLQVGTPLITIRSSAGTTETTSPTAHEQYRQEERASSGNVLIGYGTSEDTRKRRRRVGSGPKATTPSTLDSEARVQKSGQFDQPHNKARVISPIVRNLARGTGVDLTTVKPTGTGGVIRRSDVEQALRAVGTHAPNVPPARPMPGDQRLPLKGLRKAVADKLSTSRREIPDATTWVDVDATNLLQARRTINDSFPESQRISLLALLARLTIVALQQFPELNSTVDTDRNEIVRFGHIHLGIAAQTPRGLIVPVIDNADLLTTVELTHQLQETTTLARDGKLPPTRLTRGTFTLNNYGVFGVDGSTPIINHPEAAILGVGRIFDKPWVVGGQLVVRKITQISLSFDHRVCDGGTAGGFLRLFGDYIENPVAALGRL